MNYSADQQEFFDQAIAGENIFLTGKAGTGKSFITKEVVKELSKTKKVAVVAPTGVAASNAGGATMHSTFSLPIHGLIEYKTCNFLKSKKRDVIDRIEVLFIDEISMVRPDMLDAVNWTMKKNGCKGLDEIQIIFVGDMAQLKPVMDDNFKTMTLKKYKGLDFRYSNIFKKINCKTIELNEVLRQSDQEFIENLNIVREGNKSSYFKKFVHTQTNGIVLAPHNATVKRYNQIGLDSIKEPKMTFKAKIEGNAKEGDFNFESKLELKNGCKIMYLVNSKNNNLVNGTIGTFIVEDSNLFIKVGNERWLLEKYKLSKKEYVLNAKTDELELQEVGSIEQYPVKLAYAASIHRSQGLTFEEMSLDLSLPCFAEGQLYVGLSRVTSPKGLRIIVNR